jgi:hypothetical protein
VSEDLWKVWWGQNEKRGRERGNGWVTRLGEFLRYQISVWPSGMENSHRRARAQRRGQAKEKGNAERCRNRKKDSEMSLDVWRKWMIDWMIEMAALLYLSIGKYEWCARVKIKISAQVLVRGTLFVVV